MIKHIRRWNIWRKRSMNSTPYKLFVLFGIIKSPTFSLTMLPEEAEEFKRAFMNIMRDIRIEK